MSEAILRPFPPGISQGVLARLLEDMHSQEALLQGMIRRFEQRYKSLEATEARLARGEGPEHPDWEDSIEWRNAIETLQRTQVMRNLLEWLLRSVALSPAS